jgi:hypothetical protein
MKLYRALFCLFAMQFGSYVSAQQSACTARIPATVYLPDGVLLRHLRPNQFVAHSKSENLSISSAPEASGGRRVVFVVETGKRLPDAARKIQAGVLSEIISVSAPDDMLGLVTAHGPRLEVPLGENREALKNAIDAMENAPNRQTQQNGILDSIQEAAMWLEPHQEGDAIVVLTMGIERDSSHASFGKVKDKLVSSGVRLFGFQLGMVVSGIYSIGVSALPGGSGYIPHAYVSPNEESLNALSVSSGGFLFAEDTEGTLKTYRLTDQRLTALKNGGKQFYKAIREYYLLGLQVSAGNIELDIAAEVRARVPKAEVAYPRKKDYCTSAANGAAHE